MAKSNGDEDINFKLERKFNIQKYPTDEGWNDLSKKWLHTSFEKRYMYNFDWLGRPIIQSPIDIVAMQELIWEVKPDLIIETGIAHGGSLIFSASLLALLDISEAIESGLPFDPRVSSRKVVGVDIDIRSHNRKAIESHPMKSRIQMIEGSSISTKVIEDVRVIAKKFKKVLVCLDSNHTHDHVYEEMEAYATLVTKDSYCVVFDTIVDDFPKSLFPDRPWGPGNNPKTAVHKFLKIHEEFEVDKLIENKLMLSLAPDGYLKRIK